MSNLIRFRGIYPADIMRTKRRVRSAFFVRNYVAQQKTWGGLAGPEVRVNVK